MTTFSTSRRLPFSPDQVHAALADPQRLARWWGPNGFRNRFQHFDFVEGGHWVFEMIAPDGRVYPNESVFRRIVPGRCVVIDHVCAPLFELTITLEPRGDATFLRWDQRFDDPVLAEQVRAIVVPSNEQNLDRLTAELAA